MNFNINIRSPLFIERYLLMLVSLCAGIVLLFANKYVISIVFLVIFLVLVIRFFEVPQLVSLGAEFIVIGNNKIIWKNVVKVEFTISDPGRDYNDTVIIIFTDNQKHVIHTRLYNNYVELRSLFELISSEKGIPFITKDKGLY